MATQRVTALAASRPLAPTGRWAFAALLVFVVLLYANPGNLLPELGELAYAKAAAAIAIAALGGAWLLRDRPLHAGGRVGALLACFFAWMGLSAIWSLWPSMTIDAFLDGLKYLAIFFLVANVVDSRARAVGFAHAVAFSTVIPAVGAISSWLRGEHLVEGDRAGWIGIFANPNDLAHYLVVGIAFALGGRAVARARWLKIAYWPALALIAAALLLTQSRGGLLAAATVVTLWPLRGAASWRGRARIAVAVAAAVALTVHLAPETTLRRAETAFDYREDASAQGRIDAWRTGWNVTQARPFTGVGAGAFPLAWPEFAPGDAGPPRTAHNTFIQLLAETGLPALALFVSALAAAFLGLRKLTNVRSINRQTSRNSDYYVAVPIYLSNVRSISAEAATLAAAVQVGLAGFVVCSLTGGYAYSWPLYLLLGLAAALPRADFSTEAA